jgi:hypothetical protein
VELAHPDLSVRRQCELLGVNRAGLYYQPREEQEENLHLMRLLDEQYIVEIARTEQRYAGIDWSEQS